MKSKSFVIVIYVVIVYGVCAGDCFWRSCRLMQNTVRCVERAERNDIMECRVGQAFGATQMVG